MNLIITGRHMEVTAALKEAVERKMDKLGHLLEHVIEVNVVLSVEKIHHLAEMTIMTDNGSFFSEVRTEDMYESIDKLFEKAERQVKKFREKISDRKQVTPLSQVFEQDSYNRQDENPISRVVEISPKPMTSHEALLQMRLDELDFYIFQKETEDHAITEAVLMKESNQAYIQVCKEADGWLKQRLIYDGTENLEFTSTETTDIRRINLPEAVDMLRSGQDSYVVFFDEEIHNLNIIYLYKNNKIGLVTSDHEYRQRMMDRFVM